MRACEDGKDPLLVSGSTSGHLAVWSLQSRKLVTVLRDAHAAPVVSAAFLPNEPVLVTSGADNALKVWLGFLAHRLPRVMACGVVRCSCCVCCNVRVPLENERMGG